MKAFVFPRRTLLAMSAALVLSAPGLSLAQAKMKVAAIYTVPFEQQWVSRIHKALKAAEARGEIEYKASENVSNADYERVMREYATGGNELIVGEAFAVEAAARKVAKDFPKTSFARFVWQAAGT
jgi:basic membrane protein A